MIGALKHVATIEKMLKQSNGRGGWTTYPGPAETIFVAQYEMTERIITEFRKAGFKADTKFLARYMEGVDEGAKLTLNGKTYEVERVILPPDPRDYMEIFCVGD